MILIIGGQGAGKRAYARSLGFSDADMASAILDTRPVLADLHLLLRDPAMTDDRVFETLCAKQAVLCNEVGCGIVPMDREERAWRERVGRMCTRLAARAEKVVRVVCGIPVVLKPSHGERPKSGPMDAHENGPCA